MLEWILDGLKTVSKQSARGMRNSLCWWKQIPFVRSKTMQKIITTTTKLLYPLITWSCWCQFIWYLRSLIFIPSIDVFTSYNSTRHDHLTPKIYFDSITKLNKNQTKTVILLIFKRQPFEGFVSTVSVMICLHFYHPKQNHTMIDIPDLCSESILNTCTVVPKAKS